MQRLQKSRVIKGLNTRQGADNSNMFKTEYLRAMAGSRCSAAGAYTNAAPTYGFDLGIHKHETAAQRVMPGLFVYI